MSYDGFFIRDYVGETIDGPKGTNWTNSPDIICPGPTPLQDPNSILLPANYNAGLPNVSNQTPLVNNNVYIRGVNPQAVEQTSTVYLYYVDTSIVLWPQNWKWDSIQFNGTYRNWQQLTAPPASQNQGIAGTVSPFLWMPPKTSNHYCLVGWANNGTDQLTPPDLGSIGSVPDMAAFILAHPNIGWKNTTEVDATVPTIQGVAPISGPSSGGLLSIGLQCQNLPTDGYISFSVPGPDADNTIIFEKTKIPSKNYGPTFQVEYPAMPGGFQTQMSWAYYQGATPAPAGSNVIPFIANWGMSAAFHEEVKKKAPGHLIQVHNYGSPKEFRDNRARMLEALPATPTIMVIGSIPFKLTR